ncbi:MAG TPA: alpha/beta fold hydrolase [Pirellulales bacterium]|nr:alpha/beta fold hydrolase [Pirellulales bacterium]
MLPPFEPHRWLKNPHAQTIAAAYLPGGRRPYQAKRHSVSVAGDDQIVLHEDCPEQWQPGDRTALMIHGLAGCHMSSYMVRISKKLKDRNVRAFRMDMRGCGAGLKLAKLPYHAGRTEDTIAAMQYIAALCPGSPLTLVGFSIGGHVALKLAGELGATKCAGLDRVIAVCPPLDLHVCSGHLEQPSNRFYSRHLLSVLFKLHLARKRQVPGAAPLQNVSRPSSLRELDDQFIAPAWGFDGASDYYDKCSAINFLDGIRIPTYLLAARDDPLVPIEQFRQATMASNINLHITDHGGHLGFVGRAGVDPDRRWMDWRVVEWV